MARHRTLTRTSSLTPGLLVTLWALLPLAMASPAAAAESSLQMPALFADHMVLQRDEPVAVWGWAAPKATVTVQIAGQTKTASADDKGQWKTTLDPLSTGGPLSMTIAADTTITITDILVGEVWVCSGQSNMAWRLELTADPQANIAKATHPNLRLFTVTRTMSPNQAQTDCTGQWQACTPDVARKFSAVGYYYGVELLRKLDVPVGIINSSVGGTPVESWTSPKALAATAPGPGWIRQWERQAKNWNPQAAQAKYERQLAKWETAQAKYQQQLTEREAAQVEPRPAGARGPRKPRPPRKPRKPGDPIKSAWYPSTLYNGMIAPLVPYTIRGAIWYQGESNAGRNRTYRELFSAMITDWRKAWGKPTMPFYFVQLANYDSKPSAGAPWAYLREAQTQTLALPNTGMAVIIDIGEGKNIHPKNKQDVSKRLALWALAKLYDRPVVYSGPLYQAMAVEGSSIRLRFAHADGLAAKAGRLQTFKIAGADKVFHAAAATIDGSTAVVSSDSVAKPVAVRYAWANNPEGCNLVNGAGLPASPFRTDTWEAQK